MNVNEFLRSVKKIEVYDDGYSFRYNAPRIVCKSGLSMSVQVSNGHYCEPRIDDADYYYEVEIGYPHTEIELLMEYAEEPSRPLDTVYRYVPVELVDEIIEENGGIDLAKTLNPQEGEN